MVQKKKPVSKKPASKLTSSVAKVTSHMGDKIADAKETFEEVKEKAKESIEEAKWKTRETLEEVKEKAKETFEEVKEKTKETFGWVADKVKHDTEGIKEDMKQFGKSHPFAFLDQLETFGQEHLVKRAPFQLPKWLVNFLVTIAPYVIIISAIFAIPAILTLLWLSSNHMWSDLPRYGYVYSNYRTMFWLTSILSIIAIVFELLALPGLFNKKKQWRNLIFYAWLISLLGLLIGGNIIGFIISLIVGMYILFQLRSHYK